MTSQTRHRLAALLAILPGLLTITEGGSVLFGLSTKPYTILPWLVWYNVVMGFVSVMVGIGLLKPRASNIRSATTVLTLHGLVLMFLVILFAFKEPVAVISIMAMLFRTAVWSVIVLLVRRTDKTAA